MKPTMKLRWTFKTAIFQRNNESPMETKVQVLQQWWEPQTNDEYIKGGEWREIPLEEQ